MTWSNTLDTNTPDGAAQKVPVIDDTMKTDKKAWQERLNTCLYLPLTGTQISSLDAGKIRKLHFKEAVTKPTLVAGEGALYLKLVGSVNEIFWQQADGTEKQITTAGKLNLASAELLGILANNTYFTAVNAAGTGTVNLIKANGSNLPVLPDASQLATSAAPTADADIANKNYVDDQVAALMIVPAKVTNVFGAWASKSNNTVYEALSDGFVCATTTNGATQLYGYTDSSNPPTTCRLMNYGNGGAPPVSIDMPVRKGDYWKVVGAATVYWLPIGS